MNLGFDVNEWENTEAVEMGDFETLEVGGHELIIKSACLHDNPQTHNTTLKIEVDVAGDDKQAGFYQKMFDENPNADKKWATGATKYMAIKGNGLKFTKGFIETILPNSNANFKGMEDLKQKGYDCLKGLKCAGVFGLEEYLDGQGVKRTAVKLQNFRSLDKLSEIKIPKVKLLSGALIDYEQYINNQVNNPIENDLAGFEDIVELDENFTLD